MHRSSHASRFDHPNNIWWSLQIISSSLCIFLYSLVTSSILDSNILLNTLFSDTLSLHFLLNVSDQVLHPYKTTRKITVLYILIIYSCGPEHWKTKDSAPNDSKHSMT
jgi:hypothetical protein